MGLGAFGGGSQMLFGGSGGQDIFQKITWVLGALFIAGSLVLSLMKSHQSKNLAIRTGSMPAQHAPQTPGQ
jgi:preprotein translocase subunit SecG